jgi:hypothetical protein
VPTGLVILIVLVALVIVRGQVRSGAAVVSENAGGSTAVDIGGAIMVDPNGDTELAKLVLARAKAVGTPQVILSRKVVGGELPCLGFGGITNFEMRPTVMFGLVVLEGTLLKNFLGEGPSSFPYRSYLYDLQYGGITASGPLSWGSLRATFGSSAWPRDNPMYLSPEGQPNLAELGAPFRPMSILVPKAQGQDVNKSQSVNGWTVTVARVYAQGISMRVQYTATGPGSRTRFTVERPLLDIGGEAVEVRSPGDLEIGGMGPSVDDVGFYGLPEAEQPQEIAMHFAVPAIHVRPAVYPCEIPGLKLEQYPTPTRILHDIQPGCCESTPAPDVETVGPFSFDLKVHVEPEPTQPVVPTAVPTIALVNPPAPVSTGKP